MSNYSNHSKTANAKSAKDDTDLSDLKDSVTALGQHMQEDSIQIAKTVRSAAQSKMDDAQGRANDYADQVKKQMKDYPLQTVAIAFGAGALLSILLGRR